VLALVPTTQEQFDMASPDIVVLFWDIDFNKSQLII
jgi:hypothetical protein